MTNTLVVGGSSGLGLELGILFSENFKVYITGRRDPNNRNVVFVPLDLGFEANFDSNLDKLVFALPHIDLLIYSAGFYQEGKIDDLSDLDIIKMNNVGLLAPALLIQCILKKQGGLDGFIAITSTSQWTPRLSEPMYTAVKAGLAMLANSISMDSRVGKTLVVGPAGMATRFWDSRPRSVGTLLDPAWVAKQIKDLYVGDFKYKFARILREPPRVEVVEMR